MFRLQPVDRDDDVQSGYRRPGFGKRAEGAGDQLNVDTFVQNQRDEGFHFPITDERVSTNDGKMERTVLLDDFKNTVNQFLALAVSQLAERCFTA